MTGGWREERLAPLARAATDHALAYPYRVWGFGEDIALRALLDVAELTGDPRPAAFVAELVGGWSRARPALTPADHVAPGVPLLELFERGGEDHLLGTALALGRLLAGFPRVDGVAVHRGDLAGWTTTVWVDCTALDGPFLARLGRVTGDGAWSALAVDQLAAYARVLRDPGSGLWLHGYDVATRRASDHRWARGNGWALHGLVDTLAELPPHHPARSDLLALLEPLLAALAAHQDGSGLWRTLLDDPASPLERSTAPLFASAALKARRLGLVPASQAAAVAAMIDRAVAASLEVTGDDGALQVSSATPVGDRATYVERTAGVYPWGQGPLLLTLIERRRPSAAEATV